MRNLQGWASGVGAQQFDVDRISMVWHPRVGTQSLRAGRRKCLSFWVGGLLTACNARTYYAHGQGTGGTGMVKPRADFLDFPGAVLSGASLFVGLLENPCQK